MANHKSAEKRARQNIKKALINKIRLSKMKTEIKKLSLALKNNETSLATELMKKVESIIAKTAKPGTISKNSAARKISIYAKRVNLLAGKK